MHEGILHNDGPLDWNLWLWTQSTMGPSPMGAWHLPSARRIHWPPRCVSKHLKYVAATSPMVNQFCSYGNDFKSICVYISRNVACPFNAAVCPFFGLCAQWLLALLRNSLRCLVWMSPFLPLLPIVGQIWERRSTTFSNGIGYIVDVIWSTMLSLPVLQHWGIMRTIQPKLRWENVNKRLTSEKCEFLLPSALPFIKYVRNIWSWG